MVSTSTKSLRGTKQSQHQLIQKLFLLSKPREGAREYAGSLERENFKPESLEGNSLEVVIGKLQTDGYGGH